MRGAGAHTEIFPSTKKINFVNTFLLLYPTHILQIFLPKTFEGQMFIWVTDIEARTSFLLISETFSWNFLIRNGNFYLSGSKRRRGQTALSSFTFLAISFRCTFFLARRSLLPKRESGDCLITAAPVVNCRLNIAGRPM